MDRLGVGDLRSRDDPRDIEITVDRGARADADRLVSEADVAGTVQAILVENGQPVEFDEPMFVIA
jgi:multidrug resistance efflux pump